MTIYYIREGFLGIRRHLLVFLGSVCVITACLTLTGSFALLAQNLNYNIAQLINENEFVAYLEDGMDDDQAEEMEATLEAVDNVRDAVYVSSTQAMENYLTWLEDNGRLFADLPEDLLPARYLIYVEDIDQLEATSNRVAAMDGVDHVSVSLSVAEGFSSARKVILTVAAFLLAALLAASLLLIFNNTHLSMQGREEEIAVMKMVGATNGFVRGPFVVEGTVIGLVSGLLSFALERGVYEVFQRIVESYQFSDLFYVIPFRQLRAAVFAVYLGGALLIGIFGSITAIRRLLKV
ncbi:MAG: permease-like cell division protein FtsX [Clostridiales bacterium]|nr:permease-like cell division protein FtsX [Clostridiales bacterium]